MVIEFDKAKQADLDALELPDDYSVDVEKHSDSIRCVDLVYEGNIILRVTGDFGLKVLVPAAPKMVKRWFVVGEIAGVPIEEEFEDSYSANRRKRTLEEKDAVVEVEEREVPDLESV